MDLRCEGGKKHAEFDDGIVKFKCNRPACGAAPGVVVEHHFDGVTGNPIKTVSFRDADHERSGSHGAADRTAVRYP